MKLKKLNNKRLIINILKSFNYCNAYPLIIYKMPSLEIATSIANVSLFHNINKIVKCWTEKGKPFMSEDVEEKISWAISDIL